MRSSHTGTCCLCVDFTAKLVLCVFIDTLYQNAMYTTVVACCNADCHFWCSANGFLEGKTADEIQKEFRLKFLSIYAVTNCYRVVLAVAYNLPAFTKLYSALGGITVVFI